MKRIIYKNIDKRKSLLQAIAVFEGGTMVSIKRIRILNNNEAILYYEETVESSLVNRSLSYVGKTKR